MFQSSLRTRSAFIISATLGLCALATVQATAQDRRQNEPGQFDFYLLTLSWSPSFCAASAERTPPAIRGEDGADQAKAPTQAQAAPPANETASEGASDQPRRTARRTRDQQCGDRPYAFVVHGLWPQYEGGFPEFCQSPAPRLNRNIVSSMLDLMPSPQLIFHEWDRHGTCSGLSARAYFDNVRRARAVVKIPEQYLALQDPLTVSPTEVEDAFVKANAGMTRASISVACDSKRLNEIRICMSKDFKFQDCPDVAQRTCKRDKLVMPPVRRADASAR
jgi:ribonuclease T2